MKRYIPESRSPGLVVMGGDSCSEGCGFKSHHHVLDGYFSHLFVVKFYCLFQMTKINDTEAGDGPFFENERSNK